MFFGVCFFFSSRRRHTRSDRDWSSDVCSSDLSSSRPAGPRYPRRPVADEFVLDTPVVRRFVADVRASIERSTSPGHACELIRPTFASLLGADGWLPPAFQAPVPGSGMGGGIGQWLLFRAGDGSLSLFVLVVPSCSATPVHDHLAWGLVGLYRGAQDEEIYETAGGELRLVETRALEQGDFYTLLPPRNDVHRVRTTSSD